MTDTDTERALTVTWQTEYRLSWTRANDTGMEAYSHALRDGGDVWIIDPIDGPGSTGRSHSSAARDCTCSCCWIATCAIPSRSRDASAPI